MTYLSTVPWSYLIALYQLGTKQGDSILVTDGIVVYFVLGVSSASLIREQSHTSPLLIEINMTFIMSVLLFYMLTPAIASTNLATPTTPSGRNIARFRFLLTSQVEIEPLSKRAQRKRCLE